MISSPRSRPGTSRPVDALSRLAPQPHPSLPGDRLQVTSVLVLGDVSYNTLVYLAGFPQPRPQTIFAQRLHETVGESGAGKALNLGKLGLDVTFHALIGEDRFGGMVREYLAGELLRFLYDVDAAGTQRHVNLMDQDGARISLISPHSGPQPPIDMGSIAALIPGGDYMVLGIAPHCRGFIPLLEASGKDIWCDIHDYDGRDPYHLDFINAANYLFMSSDEMPGYMPFMTSMVAAGKKLVVCTHGRMGSSALASDGRWYETPIVESYQRRDTNGAGDAFFAGFLYGHSLGHTVERCLRLGTITAGLCVTSDELALPGLSASLLEAEYRRNYPD